MATATKSKANGKAVTPKNRIAALAEKSTARKGMTIEIPAPDFGMVTVPIVGLTSLISHPFSKKAMNQIKDKQMGKATKGRKAKDPKEEFEGCIYRIDKKRFGFPAIAFKLAMVRAAKGCGMQMTDARAAFQVLGEAAPDGGEDLVEIKGKPTPREDMVRLQGTTADWRIRAEFIKWETEFVVRFNRQMISAEQVFNLANLAGSGTGVGDWRPERNGQHGMFEVKVSKKARK